MMSKTHIAVGVAASLAVLQPATLVGCFAATLGGAAGSIISDIDTRSNSRCRDAFYGRVIAGVIVLVMLASDYRAGGGVCEYLVAHIGAPVFFGAVAFVAIGVVGALSRHRTFTHSLLFFALVVLSVAALCPLLVVPFAIGILSHLALDLLNKKPIQLFFPLKKGSICLGLCRADGVANTAVMIVGLIASVALFAWRVSIAVS